MQKLQNEVWVEHTIKVLSVCNFFFITLLIFDNLALNKQMMALIQVLFYSAKNLLKAQMFMLIVSFPFVLLTFFNYSHLLQEFNDISWTTMTLYKMTIGDQLTYYFWRMFANQDTLAQICIVYLVVMISFLYALILSIVSQEYNKYLMTKESSEKRPNLVNSVFCCMIKIRKRHSQ